MKIGRDSRFYYFGMLTSIYQRGGYVIEAYTNTFKAAVSYIEASSLQR